MAVLGTSYVETGPYHLLKAGKKAVRMCSTAKDVLSTPAFDLAVYILFFQVLNLKQCIIFLVGDLLSASFCKYCRTRPQLYLSQCDECVDSAQVSFLLA